MITLDLDLGFLSKYFNIGTKSLKEYQGKSISQIMELEAKKGNTAAAKYMLELTSNPEKLAKLFQLWDPKNRYILLLNMNKEDLTDIMQFLTPAEMVLGLSIFTQEALLELMMLLEPEALATVLLSQMDSDKFLQILPEKYLNEFMSSDRISRDMFMIALQSIDDEYLQQMMENYTGQSCYDNKDTILGQVSSLSDDEFMKAMYAFEPKGKQLLISNLLIQKPELFEEFSPEAMIFPFKSLQKDKILKSLTVLDTKDMMPMVKDLSTDIMALIATQIDPSVFSEILCTNFKDVIGNCGIKL